MLRLPLVQYSNCHTLTPIDWDFNKGPSED
jgi:hypothetical protein